MFNFSILKKIILSVLILLCILWLVQIKYWAPSVEKKQEKETLFFRSNQDSLLPDQAHHILVLAPRGSPIQPIDLLNDEHQLLSKILPTSLPALSGYDALDVVLPPLSEGRYFMRYGDKISSELKVGPLSTDLIIQNTLSFFNLQRCGNRESAREACHLSQLKKSSGETLQRDLLGGWHDAGDYIRFVMTSSYATLLLLVAAEHMPVDHPLRLKLLNEAEWGAKWLDKMWDEQSGILTQLGDASDHERWRLPEQDDRDGHLPAIVELEKNAGANLAGRVAASFALLARLHSTVDKKIWQDKAIRVLASMGDRKKSQSASDNFYKEKEWRDDVALAALELYELTGQKKYLQQAEALSVQMEEFWAFGYSQIHPLVDFKLALHSKKHKKIAIKRMQKTLNRLSGVSQKNIFLAAVKKFYWGSQYEVLGAGILALLYEKATLQKTYRGLAVNQWDYTLGKNPWGLSFVSGVGSRWLKKPHHQIAQMTKSDLVGYWAPGAVAEDVWLEQKIELAEPDTGAGFQSSVARLHDDSQDYVTNEPTISMAATGTLLTVLLSF